MIGLAGFLAVAIALLSSCACEEYSFKHRVYAYSGDILYSAAEGFTTDNYGAITVEKFSATSGIDTDLKNYDIELKPIKGATSVYEKVSLGLSDYTYNPRYENPTSNDYKNIFYKTIEYTEVSDFFNVGSKDDKNLVFDANTNLLNNKCGSSNITDIVITLGELKDKILPQELDPTNEDHLDLFKFTTLENVCGTITFSCPEGKNCAAAIVNTNDSYEATKSVVLVGEDRPTTDGSLYKGICAGNYERVLPENNIIARNIIIKGHVKFYTINPNQLPFKLEDGKAVYDSESYSNANIGFQGLTVKDETNPNNKTKLINFDDELMAPKFIDMVDQRSSYCFASVLGAILGTHDVKVNSLSKDYYEKMGNTTYAYYQKIDSDNDKSYIRFLVPTKVPANENGYINNVTLNPYKENDKEIIYVVEMANGANEFLSLYPFEYLDILNILADEDKPTLDWSNTKINFAYHKICFTRNNRIDVTKGTNGSQGSFVRTPEGTIGYGDKLEIQNNSQLITDEFTYLYASDIFAQKLSYIFTYAGDEKTAAKSTYTLPRTFKISVGESAVLRANTANDVVYELDATANNAAEEYQCYIKSSIIQNQNIEIESYTNSLVDLNVATLPWVKTNIYSRYLNLSPGATYRTINIKYAPQTTAFLTNDMESYYFKTGSLVDTEKNARNSNLYLLLTTTTDQSEKLTGNVSIQNTVTDRITLSPRQTDSNCEDGYYVANHCVPRPADPVKDYSVFSFTSEQTDTVEITGCMIESIVQAVFEYPRRMSVTNVTINGLLEFSSGQNSYKPNQMNVTNKIIVGETGLVRTSSKNLNVKCSFDKDQKNRKNTIGGSSFGCGSSSDNSKKKNVCPTEQSSCTYPKENRINAIEGLNKDNTGISINYFVGVPGNTIYREEGKENLIAQQKHAGGGIIILTCILQLDGEINADGEDADADSLSSAGSGGSIRIDMNTCQDTDFRIDGKGHFSVRGGNASGIYGAGSGGVVFMMSSTSRKMTMSENITIDLNGGSGSNEVRSADEGYYHNIPLCGYFRHWLVSSADHPGKCSLSTIPIVLISVAAVIVGAYIIYCIAIAIRNYVKRNVDLPLSYNPFRMRKNQISSALVNGRTLNIVALASKEGWLIDPAELTIGEFLGKGGNASVYKGVYRGSMVAVKKIAIDAQNEKVLADLTRETLLMSRLRHPHCLAFYGAYFTDAEATLVIELAPWGDLRKLINAFYGKFSVPNNKYVIHILRLMQQILSALQHLHTQTPPVVHRDLKPGNILLRNKDSAVLADFGISRALDKNSANSTICGTPAYAAPESANNKLSVKYDIYCFGTIIWEALTGKKPFSDIANPLRIMAELQSRGAPSDLTEEVWKKYPDIKQLVSKCWTKNPEERPDVQEVAKIMHDLYAKYNALQSESRSTPGSSSTASGQTNASSTPANENNK